MGSKAPLIDISEDSLVSFEIEVMSIPQIEEGQSVMISQGPSVCIFNKEDPQEVLASWLFVQFLLTDEVQIGYSQTEGYAPVTLKAQNSPQYQDYLSRAGEDNELYYHVKLAATRLLLDHTENTFVTPVFNGSASLRNAAGQLIEDVNKGAKRGKTVDEAFIATLYEDVSSLYRLDKTSRANSDVSGTEEFGELPATAKMLIGTLVGTWTVIGAYVGITYLKKREK